MNTQNPISSWMKESLSNYVAQLALSKSAPTIEAYHYDVAKFLEYLNSHQVRRLSSVRASHIVSYLGECKQVGKSDSSINRYYMAIRSYFRFLRRDKKMLTDLTEDVTVPKNVQKAPYVPQIDDMERLLKAPNPSTMKGVRDIAILELLYSSGLRASELCALTIDDFKDGCVLVKCGKGGKTRTVPITLEAKGAILQYIEQYRCKEKGPLFLTQMGKSMDRQRLAKMVKHYAKVAGINTMTTHSLRHACATHLLDQGADLRLIQEVLGHSSIASTQRYTQLSSSKMKEMFNTFHPRKTHV
jgi:integrase/recombinase XerD